MKCYACGYVHIPVDKYKTVDRIAKSGKRKGQVIGKEQQVIESANRAFFKLSVEGKLDFTCRDEDLRHWDDYGHCNVVACPECGTLKMTHYSITK